MSNPKVDTGANTTVQQTSTERQTPRTDFGTIIKAGTSTTLGAVQSVASVAEPFVPGGAVLSAAVVGAQSWTNNSGNNSSNARVGSGGIQAATSNSGGTRAVSGGFGGPSYAAPPTGVGGSNISAPGGVGYPSTGGVPAGGAGGVGGAKGAAGIDLEELRVTNMQYLQLQARIGQETQQFMTISNVMKAKDDAAKNTIRNTSG